MMSIRVYKAVNSNFEVKPLGDQRSAAGCSTIESAARYAAHFVAIHFRSTEDVPPLVRIDFEPYNAIECPVGRRPTRCIPLTTDEQEEFWPFFQRVLAAEVGE